MDAPRFASCRPDEDMRSGFHVARRHDWTDPRRREVVWLEVWSDGRGDLFAILRCGCGKVEDPHEWVFLHRVIGVDDPSKDTIELEAVDVSSVMH